MPVGAVVLTVQLQRGKPQLWAKVDPTAPKERRTFAVLGTGYEVGAARSDEWIYCGTFQLHEGALVFHVFDCGAPHENAKESVEVQAGEAVGSTFVGLSSFRWRLNEGSPGTLMTWESFVEDVHGGMLTDYDGTGYLATATANAPDFVVDPTDVRTLRRPAWATHVLWFNK